VNEVVPKTMPDFSQPGSDGELPPGVPTWREGLGELMPRGVIYTARGACSILACDRQYRLSAGFKIKVPKDTSFTGYSMLYTRVRLLDARAAQLRCAHGEPVHKTIVGHTWALIPGSSHDLPMAVLVVDCCCARKEAPEGLSAPTADELLAPGGLPPEQFSPIVSERRDRSEFYNEYDVADRPANESEPYSFSYGEHVTATPVPDYEPFVKRAEERARFYHRVLNHRGDKPFVVWRRQWFAASETFIVAVIYFSDLQQ
jgi:hypothetical protein